MPWFSLPTPWSAYPGDNLPLIDGQFREDEEAYVKYFYGRSGGSFLELGALDGKSGSITRAFGQIGWHGVLVEASPESYAQLKVNRPSDAVTIHAAICDKARLVHYTVDGSACCRGIAEFMSTEFLTIWHSYLLPSLDFSHLPTVTCVPLAQVFHTLGVTHINLFILDTEGGELAVLQSVDLNKVTFDVVIVEADNNNLDKNQGVRDVLAAHGYTFVGHNGLNDWFKRNDFVASSREAPVRP